MPTSRTDELPRLAAIDIGTNSIRLVVAEPDEGGTYRVLDEEREMTRLGQGLTSTGRLADETMERSLDAIGKMKAIADGLGVRRLRAVATSAVREAENGEAFRREARRRHGVTIEVISPHEEAQLAFESARRRFDLDGRAVAVADIGGGSLEVVLSAGDLIDLVTSLPLGTVRLSERLVRSDPLRKRDWRSLRKTIDRALERGIGKPPFTVEVIVGSGGTFTALGGMVRYEREGSEGNPHGYTITRAEAARVLARLLEVPLEGRRHLAGLPPQRADIIVAGAAVVVRLAKYLGCRQILINDGGVRDGLLLSMLGESGGVPEHESGRGRLETVRQFARKCRSNARHNEHIAGLALQIFDRLAIPFGMPDEARDLLEAAALVHDVGFLVNHAQHHKHAYHLIMHSDLAGYSSHEIELIANVVRYHRRASPRKSHANFARLALEDQAWVRRLAGVLRVAVALDRSHTQVVREVQCYVRRGRVRLTLIADREPQVEMWDALRKTKLFEKAFDVELEVTWKPGVGKGRAGLRVVQGRRATG